ncbi:hypothetical protein [Anabaena azotica]|uniref:Uncharacterized protein n=1 Tax=Anabaena azotica FACHB-119 TaxID=947527 RepID=A0ABR8DAW2_9NOST|nr:hypothetical protein [Anabaena azotica]MBD2504057.1 hypothetical protein [Anabaena azotica FACHB-119]
MKSLAVLLATTLVIGSNVGISLALPPARNVYSQDAQGSNSRGIDLKVWSGYGLTINFIPTGEIIKQVWLGDPSRFALTSNGNLCQRGASNDENCGTGGATVLFLRQIKPINFPALTASKDGSTVITVITVSAEGQKQYQFKLTPAGGSPDYTTLIIKPDSEKPTPVLVEKPPVTQISSLPTQSYQVRAGSGNGSRGAGEQRGRGAEEQRSRGAEEQRSRGAGEQRSRGAEERRSRGSQQAINNNLINSSNSRVSAISTSKPNENLSQQTNNNPVERTPENKVNLSTTNSLQVGTSLKRNDANALAYGLGLAVNNGVIKPKSGEWRKAQDTIRLLRRGKTRVEAIRLSGIPQELFNKLIEWGQN